MLTPSALSTAATASAVWTGTVDFSTTTRSLLTSLSRAGAIPRAALSQYAKSAALPLPTPCTRISKHIVDRVGALTHMPLGRCRYTDEYHIRLGNYLVVLCHSFEEEACASDLLDDLKQTRLIDGELLRVPSIYTSLQMPISRVDALM